MWVLLRAVVYGSAFVGFVLVFLPGQTLAWSGVARPSPLGLAGWLGTACVTLGVVPMAWSFLSFVFRGRGTPAPFDPPRRLVVEGPYRFVRNPMYLGAVLSLAGAAVAYRSWWLAGYAAAFTTWAHLFVVGFEEPRLERRYGEEYRAYLGRVGRWLPRRPLPR